ncbi:MAG: RHS repeat-associated core domain-containing protein [Myxococcales bacterium]|nr:RHS repeat-associated core domain-containing protein [Myxococcales bacterium]MCB9519772.1 RHS repeat-associated core domain-containing protein [Myxococcales bacterium]MCB9530462.1 RHS repeat-associated core domain-containing protein [Myxococcales bacterium]
MTSDHTRRLAAEAGQWRTPHTPRRRSTRTTPRASECYRSPRRGTARWVGSCGPPGKERDGESGLVYFGARYFAPWLGRWASADPAGAVDGNPYLVVRWSPVGLREVDGRYHCSLDRGSRRVRKRHRSRAWSFWSA